MNEEAWCRDDCRHHPFYCEENVWHLLRQHATLLPWAVLIVGRRGPVWMTAQRIAAPDAAVGWDYHVIAVVKREGRPSVLDLDSRLPFPCPLEVYLAGSFPPGAPSEGLPLFRPVSAEAFLRHLRSDRRHMRDARGRWLHPPPPWPPLSPGESNLDRWRSTEDLTFGPWLERAELSAFWG